MTVPISAVHWIRESWKATSSPVPCIWLSSMCAPERCYGDPRVSLLPVYRVMVEDEAILVEEPASLMSEDKL